MTDIVLRTSGRPRPRGAAGTRPLGRRPEWLAPQLPGFMAEDPLLRRFLGALQAIADTVVERIDGLEHVVDPGTAPAAVVPWLGGWVGLGELDEAVPTDRRRQVVAAAGRSMRAVGTAAGLRAHLEALTGGPVRVRDGGGVWRAGEGRRSTTKVVVDLGTTGGVPVATLLVQVRAMLPPTARAELRVRGEVVA